jgi:hypothetical protein
MISFTFDGIEYRMFGHLYAISRCGKVLKQFKPYTPTKRKDGYLSLGRINLMHRAVAACWLEKPKGATWVHHRNENKADNRADNLEWITPKEHIAERHKGLNGNYIRTEEIRRKIAIGHTGLKDTEATRLKKAEILAAVCPKTQCKFQGVTYPSVAAGSRAAGIPPSTFRQRCGSKNFPDYELLTPPLRNTA